MVEGQLQAATGCLYMGAHQGRRLAVCQLARSCRQIRTLTSVQSELYLLPTESRHGGFFFLNHRVSNLFTKTIDIMKSQYLES